jgi:hypothetical protein
MEGGCVDIFYVLHLHMLYPDEEDQKAIGAYATYEQAEQAVSRLRQQPGFCDHPDGFFISRYRTDVDHWTYGFVTITRTVADDVIGNVDDDIPTWAQAWVAYPGETPAAVAKRSMDTQYSIGGWDSSQIGPDTEYGRILRNITVNYP